MKQRGSRGSTESADGDDAAVATAGGENGGGEPASDAASAPSGSPWRSAARSAGVRVLVLPISAILGIINTRLIIEHFGTGAYAQYGLLVAIGALLPFADLGMSAAIMNAVGESERPSRDEHVRLVLVTSVRVLICSGAVLLGITLAISAAGLWPSILGDGLLPGTGPFVAAACLALIAITLPVAFGQRVLTGLGKNHVTIAIMGLQTPVVVAVLLLLVRFDLGDGSYLPVVPYFVTMLLSLGATMMAARLIRPTIGSALRDVPRVRSVRGAKVLGIAWPALVQMIALPLAMQTDRLVLSHATGIDEVATYNLSAQLYLPVWQVATAAGTALWPIFARARARGDRAGMSPLPIAAGFGGAAAAVCLAISLLAPWLTGIASNDQISIPTSILIAFSVLMVLQAAKYPLGVFMTDEPGLRYQAVMVVLMVPVNLALSIELARRYGAVGPIIGSAVGVGVFQFLANFVYVRRVLRTERTVSSAESATPRP